MLVLSKKNPTRCPDGSGFLAEDAGRPNESASIVGKPRGAAPVPIPLSGAGRAAVMGIVAVRRNVQK